MQLNHLPAGADVMWQLCPRVGSSGVPTPVGVWKKKPSANMVYIMCIGAGGDGATVASSGTVGGGGGGSGSQTMVILPAVLVPETLHYPTTCDSTSGVWVSADSNGSGANKVCAAMPGGSGSGSTAGAAGSAVAISAMLRAGGGMFSSIAGQAGGAGGSGANGTSVSYPTTGLLPTGGCGGAGASFTGGSIAASAPRPAISVSGGAPYTASNGVDFVGGALLPSGGAGGSQTEGGAGGIGSGGGGGGGNTGSVGGAGGPGLIVIAQW